MRKFIVPIEVAVVLLLGTQVSPALGSSTPTWDPEAHEVNLPPGADPEFPFAELRSVSCGAAGSCSAVGSYSEPELHNQAMVVSQVGGLWQQAERVALPVGDEYPYLQSISCPSAGNCSAIGQIDISSESKGLVASQENGIWDTAQDISGPAGAQWTWLASVSCAANGACTAVGGYEDSSSHSGPTHPLAVSESGGVWDSAVPISVSGSPTEATLNQVDCPAVGVCVALGTVDGYKPIVASQSAGTWGSAEELPEPSGATGLGFTASDISCSGVGSCVVGGSYKEGSIERPAVVAESGGTWGAVTPLTLPADVASNNSHSELAAVSCPSKGACTVVGNYVDSSEAEKAFSAQEVAGVWQQAEQVSVPLTPDPEFPHALGWIGLDCVTAESCGAVGYAFFHETTALMENGSWGTGASSIILPPNAQSQEAGGIYAVSCGGVGSCAAVGSYVDGEGMERAIVLSTEGYTLVRHSLQVAKAGTGSGTVTSSPAGINCGSTCQAEFTEGSTVTLTATGAPGSVFSG